MLCVIQIVHNVVWHTDRTSCCVSYRSYAMAYGSYTMCCVSYNVCYTALHNTSVELWYVRYSALFPDSVIELVLYSAHCITHRTRSMCSTVRTV